MSLQLLMEVAAVPLKVTGPDPWVAPKPLPFTVTSVPTAPEVGLRPVIVGVPSTVKDDPALDTPLTVTMMLLELAPVGTTAVMEVLLQLVIEVAVTPLKVTVLEPCEEPKLVPVIVTEEPTAPDVGLRPVIVGVASTVNAEPALDTPR